MLALLDNSNTYSSRRAASTRQRPTRDGAELTPNPAAGRKFLHDAELRDRALEKQLIPQKTPKLSQSSGLNCVVVACRNADADRDYHCAFGRKSRYHGKNRCSKAQKHPPANGAGADARASRRRPRSAPHRVGASVGPTSGPGMVPSCGRGTPPEASLSFLEIAS
jgi:hypothetical protein